MKKTTTIFRNSNNLKLSAGLAFIALGSTGLLSSCGGNSDDESEYEEVEVLTKGVKSYIQETEPNQFKISKEEQTQAANTEGIVTYLDGRTENISSSKAQILIDEMVATYPDSVGKTPNLPNALLYGGVGFFLANLPGSKLAKYRSDSQVANAANHSDSTRRYRHHGSGMGFFPMFWLSRAAFSSGFRSQESMASSRIRTTRPIASRGGFFRSSGRGGFMG
jgi:hypothetical protein